MRYELENRCPHWMVNKHLERQDRLSNIEMSLKFVYDSMKCDKCKGYDTRCELYVIPRNLVVLDFTKEPF